MVQLRDACLRQSKACHFAKRYDKHRDEHHGAAIDKQIIYVVLSTNKEMAENWSPVICSCDSAPKVSFGRGETLADWPVARFLAMRPFQFSEAGMRALALTG